MLPEASAEGNILTKGEQHAWYMAEHLTIDLLYLTIAMFCSVNNILLDFGVIMRL